MFVSEFYAQAKTAFSGCDEATILLHLTDAVRLIANKGIADPNLGAIDLCLCKGCATLPRDVGTVLGINVDGQPTLIRDQWFQYHINGPGIGDCSCQGYSDELGQFCTYKDPSEPSYLIAQVTSAKDNNKKLRVFALDVNGDKIFSAGPGGTLEEGFLVPLIFGFSSRNTSIPPLSSIYRISKDVTTDFVKLLAIKSSDSTTLTQVGYYEPDEILPAYRRIRVPNKTWVRVKYKKKNLELTSQRSWINIDNREALRLACRAVQFRLLDKYDSAKAAEAESSRILSEETESNRPSGPRTPQIINGSFLDNDDSLLGGSYGGGYYGNSR